MTTLGLRRMLTFALAVAGACVAPSPTRLPAPADVPIEEIEGPIAPPGPRVVDAKGERQLDAEPGELRAAGDYYYRSGELTRALEFYQACSGSAHGSLRAACQWAIGATLVAQARCLEAEYEGREEALGLRPRPPAPRGCTRAAYEYDRAMPVLRVAHRGHPTARRALVLAALYEELGRDMEALRFYEQGSTLDPDEPRFAPAVARLRSREPRPACPNCVPTPRPECRPRDCPELPFEWHRRTGEIEIRGSGLEGSSRERVFACFGEPSNFSSETWSYARSSCAETFVRTEASGNYQIRTIVRLYFADDVVDRVTLDHSIDERACVLWTG